MDPKQTDIVQSVERCFAVLEAFKHAAPGRASVSELARVANLSRPSVRRMLLTLESLGYVQSRGPHWEMRPRILEFAHWFVHSSALATVATAHAQWACVQLDEAVGVSQIDGFDIRIVAIARAGERMIVRAEIGEHVPLHATAPGWVTLAWSKLTPQLDTTRHTRNTVTDPREVAKRIRKIHADGYVIADQEILEGMIEAGVPIFTPHGWLLGCLTIALPSWSWSAQRIKDQAIPVLTTASRRITEELNQTGLAQSEPV